MERGNATEGTESAIAAVVETTQESATGTESALTNATADAREKIEEARSDRESAITETPETTTPA